MIEQTAAPASGGAGPDDFESRSSARNWLLQPADLPRWLQVTLAVAGLALAGAGVLGQCSSDPEQRSVGNVPATQGPTTGAKPANPDVCFEHADRNRSSSDFDVDLSIQRIGMKCAWASSVSPVPPRSRVTFLVSYENRSALPQKAVEFRVELADGLAGIPGSTWLFDDDHPDGALLASDEVWSDGVILEGTDAYDPGDHAYLLFDSMMPSSAGQGCGLKTYRSKSLVQPSGLDYRYNYGDVEVLRQCS